MKDYYSEFNLSDKDREYWETKHRYVEKSFSIIEADIDNISDVLEWHRLSAEQQDKSDTLLRLLRASIPHLTLKQQSILNLYLQGFNQSQIARQLNINQTNVQKTLYGNYDVTNKKMYGGVVKKLRKLIIKRLAEDTGMNIEELLNKGRL